MVFPQMLTRRELAVLLRVADGLSDRAIGQLLDTSVETVAGHRKSLRKKLGPHDDRSHMIYSRE